MKPKITLSRWLSGSDGKGSPGHWIASLFLWSFIFSFFFFPSYAQTSCVTNGITPNWSQGSGWGVTSDGLTAANQLGNAIGTAGSQLKQTINDVYIDPNGYAEISFEISFGYCTGAGCAYRASLEVYYDGVQYARVWEDYYTHGGDKQITLYNGALLEASPAFPNSIGTWTTVKLKVPTTTTNGELNFWHHRNIVGEDDTHLRQIYIASDCKSDLSITKTVNNNNPVIGSEVIFTVAAKNNGPQEAKGVVVTDVVPAGYTVLAVNIPRGTWNAPNWAVGDLGNQATATMTIRAIVNRSGGHTNTATVKNDHKDVNTTNNTAAITPNVQLPPPAPTVTSDKEPVLVGESLKLTATGCGSGTIKWYNKGVYMGVTYDNQNPINVTPAAGDIYTATCTVGGIPSDPSNEVTPGTKPNPPVVTPNPNPPVVGQPTTLTVTGCTNGTINWFNNGTALPQYAGQNPITVTPAAGDNYTATCTVNNIPSDPSNPVTPGTKPTPPSITTPTPPIVGQPTTITATGCTTGTINWYNNGTALPQYAGQNPITVTPAAGDNYTATCTVNNIPSNPSNPVTPGTKPNPPVVTPNPNPPVVGQPTTLTVTGCTNGTINWFNNGTALPQYAGQNPITVTPAAGDNYTATCTVNNIPSDPSNPVTPGTKPTPPSITTPTPPIVGQPTTMTATGCTNGTINWFNNGTALPQYAGQNPITVTPAAGDNYTATCTVGGIPSDPSNPVTPGEAIQDYNTTIQVLNLGQYTVGSSKNYTVSYTNTLPTAATRTEQAMITAPFGWTCTGCGPVTVPALGVGQTHTVNVSLTATAAGAAGALSSNITNGSGGDTRMDNNKAAVSVRTAN